MHTLRQMAMWTIKSLLGLVEVCIRAKGQSPMAFSLQGRKKKEDSFDDLLSSRRRRHFFSVGFLGV